MSRILRLVERGSIAMSRAAFYIGQNPEKVVNSSIAEVAKACGTGESTVIRLAQALDFEGFSDLKLALAREIEREEVLSRSHDRDGAPNIRDPLLSRLTSMMLATIRDSAVGVEADRMEDMVRRLRQARHIAAYGISVSGICARVLASRLAYQGIIVQVPDSGFLARVNADALGPQDVAIGISYSGLSADTVNFMQHAKARGCHCTAITAQGDSPLAKAATHVIELSSFGAWPKDGSARLLPSIILLTEFLGELLEQDAG